MFSLLLQELRFRRNSIIGWAIGVSMLPAIYISFYPTIQEDLMSLQSILDLSIYKIMGMSFGSFEDWIASTVTTIIPVVVAVYAVMDGTRTLAGEEDEGKLELIVTMPIHRWKIVTVKAIAHGIASFIILFVTAITSSVVFLIILDQVVNPAINAWDIFFGLLSAWPVMFALGMLNLFFGAFAPNRRIASIFGIILVAVNYFGNNIVGTVSTMEKFQPIFLFHYYNSKASAFVTGQKFEDVLVLLTVAFAAYGLAVFFFHRRDISVGVWPWQNTKLPKGIKS